MNRGQWLTRAGSRLGCLLCDLRHHQRQPLRYSRYTRYQPALRGIITHAHTLIGPAPTYVRALRSQGHDITGIAFAAASDRLWVGLDECVLAYELDTVARRAFGHGSLC